MSKGSASIADLSRNDSLSREPHQYLVDAFTQAVLDNYDSGALNDAIIVREKDYYHTPINTSMAEAKEKGRPGQIYGSDKGDWDFAIIHLEDERIEHYEFSKSKESSEMKNYPCEEQLANLSSSIDLLNQQEDTDWVYEGNIVLAKDHADMSNVPLRDEWRPDVPLEQSDPSGFEGEQYGCEEAFEKAYNMDAFQSLNEGMFNGEFFEGSKIEEKDM